MQVEVETPSEDFLDLYSSKEGENDYLLFLNEEFVVNHKVIRKYLVMVNTPNGIKINTFEKPAQRYVLTYPYIHFFYGNKIESYHVLEGRYDEVMTYEQGFDEKDFSDFVISQTRDYFCLVWNAYGKRTPFYSYDAKIIKTKKVNNFDGAVNRESNIISEFAYLIKSNGEGEEVLEELDATSGYYFQGIDNDIINVVPYNGKLLFTTPYSKFLFSATTNQIYGDSILFHSSEKMVLYNYISGASNSLPFDSYKTYLSNEYIYILKDTMVTIIEKSKVYENKYRYFIRPPKDIQEIVERKEKNIVYLSRYPDSDDLYTENPVDSVVEAITSVPLMELSRVVVINFKYNHLLHVEGVTFDFKRELDENIRGKFLIMDYGTLKFY